MSLYFTRNYNLYKITSGSYVDGLTYLNKDMDMIDELAAGKQDKLIAGANITINGNVISATGGGGGSGLQWWVETPTTIYREFAGSGEISGDAAAVRESFFKSIATAYTTSTCYCYRKKNHNRALVGLMKDGRLSNYSDSTRLVIAARAGADVDWEWATGGHRPSASDIQTWNNKSSYPLNQRTYPGSSIYFDNNGYWQVTVTYEGAQWIVSVIQTLQGGDYMIILDWDDDTIPIYDGPVNSSDGATTAQQVALNFLRECHATLDLNARTQISVEGYVFSYEKDSHKLAYIDSEGAAQFTEIMTDGSTLTQKLADKQDKLTAGSGITIQNNVVSAAVSDVLVDGTSVVSSNVARINLSGKQNVLTAGSNIQITGDTISATNTTYSDMVGADGTNPGSAGLVPAPAATDNTKFLQGDGTWGSPPGATYNDFVGTDGVTAGTHGLVPAPTTSDVNKYLKSDGTWATVSGGGGGGSSVDVLFDGVTAQTITLAHSVEDYKMIQAFINVDGQNTYQLEGSYSPSLITSSAQYGGTSIFIVDPYGLNNGYYRYKFIDATHLDYYDGASSAFNRPMIVLGYK